MIDFKIISKKMKAIININKKSRGTKLNSWGRPEVNLWKIC